MNARLIKFWQDLQSSYYFIPGIMVLLTVILATATAYIDAQLSAEIARKLDIFYAIEPGGARAVLATIAGAMMTVAAVTFSITMVAVTTASGQYGPRLIGNFMRDRANQFTLGTFTSTFVYALLVLRITHAGDASSGPDTISQFVPNLSLLVAVIMTLVSVGVMIFFIHHIPETLNVGNILARVGKKLRDNIEKTFPADLGKATETKKFDRRSIPEASAHHVCAESEGFVQAVNDSAMMRLAIEHDLVIELMKQPGDFITNGEELVSIWPQKDIDDETLQEISASFKKTYAMGKERTAHQNILFLADELVEILARALSPGVNDPFTAINCINWFKSSLKAMMRANIPNPYRADDNGDVRVITNPIDFKHFADNMLGQSRNYVATDFNVTCRLLDILDDLIESAENTSQKKILRAHARALNIAATDSQIVAADKDYLKKRLKMVT
ncbi:MAG: DUF2254 domain-containing protein [Hellea sp.]|nr:DUF2254 domain-containing protein [Hellea sp.]